MPHTPATTRAINVPLAPVTKGQQRSLADTCMTRSAPVTAEIPTLPKLVVRVRFPSPARSASPGGDPRNPRCEGLCPPRPHGLLPEEGLFFFAPAAQCCRIMLSWIKAPALRAAAAARSGTPYGRAAWAPVPPAVPIGRPNEAKTLAHQGPPPAPSTPTPTALS
ncbi:hypothetical protein Airi01_069090 [Actinoallomurus iriomotensis]|uniref:Uncharacterized protein n=1 Tax=Actinoallomurus iriomotensis TaxID=478107 RepID=A0A9W6RR52_9ACTN|nr:hypothetical protein Airi01_069090 [Actinoallomurus iriomotensis]